MEGGIVHSGSGIAAVDAIRRNRLFAAIGGVLLLGAICTIYAVVWSRCLSQTEGHFTYVLDDPYIHLGIAKNLATHGVWGVTQYEFASASSSPLWTLLLAIFVKIGGDSVYWPLAFCLGFSIGTALLLYHRFIRAGIGVLWGLGAATLIFAAGPLHVLPFTGMEHCLQIFLDLIFGFWLLDAMGRSSAVRDLPIAVVLTILICACRYESIFLLVVPIIVSLLRRDWRLAGAMVLGPFLAYGGFALYSHLVGMPLIPNSILLKGHLPRSDLASFVSAVFSRAYSTLSFGAGTHSDLFLLCAGTALTLRLRTLRASTISLQVWMWTLIVACFLHGGLANFGWFFRYEAYLVVSFATVIVLSLREFLAHRAPSEAVEVSKVGWWISIGVITGLQVLMNRVGWFYRADSFLIFSTNIVAVSLLVAMYTGPRTRGRLTRSLILTLIPVAVVLTVWDRASLALSEVGDGSRDIYLQQVQMARFVSRYYPRGRLAANDIGAVTYFTRVHLLDIWGLANDDVRRLRLSGQYSTHSIGELMASFKPDLVIAYPNWYSGKTAFPRSFTPVARWDFPKTITAAFPSVTFYAPDAATAIKLRRELIEFKSGLPAQVKVEILSD